MDVKTQYWLNETATLFSSSSTWIIALGPVGIGDPTLAFELGNSRYGNRTP